MVDVLAVIVAQIALLLVLQFANFGSNFAARKACHSGSGFLMLFLDASQYEARYFVYSVVAGSLAMTWISSLPVLRFGKRFDVGITIYLLLVGTWFHLQIPVSIMAPMFFADPAGAIVGRWASSKFGSANRVWIHNKTVAGSAAVCIVTFFTVMFPITLGQRLVLAVCAMLAEAVGGAYDNLLLAACVVTAWRVV